jgi:hypothetical protein
VLVGCRGLLGIDNPIGIDAAVDGAMDGPGSGSQCLGNPGSLRICVAAAQSDQMYSGTLTTQFVGSNLQPSCNFVQPYGSGGSLCVMTGANVVIDNVNVVDAIGLRPIVFVATEKLTVTGTLDAGGHHQGAVLPPGAKTGILCPNNDGTAGGSGGGGGAGGSFATSGGRGGNGTGGSGGVAGPTQMPTTIQSGCFGGDGEDGVGGDIGGSSPGGVVYLIAPILDIEGTVSVSGEGGFGAFELAGGAGGGAGGFCGLDASTSLIINGNVVANGGGGGGAAGLVGGAAHNGTTGSDGGVVAAVGGVSLGGGGTGGDGAIASGAGAPGTPATAAGSGNGGGGGGGGGGLGVVWLAGSGAMTGSGTIEAVVINRP